MRAIIEALKAAVKAARTLAGASISHANATPTDAAVLSPPPASRLPLWMTNAHSGSEGRVR